VPLNGRIEYWMRLVLYYTGTAISQMWNVPFNPD